jgi:hypothetical protein
MGRIAIQRCTDAATIAAIHQAAVSVAYRPFFSGSPPPTAAELCREWMSALADPTAVALLATVDTSTEAGPHVPTPSGTTWAFRNSATRACSLSRQVLFLVRCAADVTRLWQRVEQNRFPRLREVSM